MTAPDPVPAAGQEAEQVIFHALEDWDEHEFEIVTRKVLEALADAGFEVVPKGYAAEARFEAVLDAAYAEPAVNPGDVEALRDALNFYADESNYQEAHFAADEHIAAMPSTEAPIHQDGGKLARAALSRVPAGGEDRADLKRAAVWGETARRAGYWDEDDERLLERLNQR